MTLSLHVLDIDQSDDEHKRQLIANLDARRRDLGAACDPHCDLIHDMLKEYITYGDGVLLYATQGPRIASIAACKRYDDDPHVLVILYLWSAQIVTGATTHLLAYIREFARLAGLTELHVVAVGTSGAFYRKLGFLPYTDERRHHMRTRGVDADEEGTLAFSLPTSITRRRRPELPLSRLNAEAKALKPLSTHALHIRDTFLRRR